jgi:hypothetical protein
MRELPNTDKNIESSWEAVQAAINCCKICRSPGVNQMPVRPPAPAPNRALFLTEAPPPTGGFWTVSYPPDQVQRNLFCILGDSRSEFKNLTPGRDGLNAFKEKFFLIQAVKWPQKSSLAPLKPRDRMTIRHSVETHLIKELQIIRPTGIFASGAAAGLACCLLAPRSGLCEFFSARGFEKEVVGQRFLAEFPGLGSLPVYFSLLLVDRHRPISKRHVQSFLNELMGSA